MMPFKGLISAGPPQFCSGEHQMSRMRTQTGQTPTRVPLQTASYVVQVYSKYINGTPAGDDGWSATDGTSPLVT